MCVVFSVIHCHPSSSSPLHLCLIDPLMNLSLLLITICTSQVILCYVEGLFFALVFLDGGNGFLRLKLSSDESCVSFFSFGSFFSNMWPLFSLRL